MRPNPPLNGPKTQRDTAPGSHRSHRVNSFIYGMLVVAFWPDSVPTGLVLLLSVPIGMVISISVFEL